MSLKKIKPKFLELNQLANQCGFFTTETDLNNGYGCTFADESSYEKQEPGCCYGFDCPMGYEARLEDLKKHDGYLYNEYKNEEFGPDESGSNWMIQTHEIAT